MQDTQQKKYKLQTTKVLYILLLLAMLMLFLFYFDMIGNSSLIDIAQVLMGFLLTLILQLKFVTYYF